MDLSLHPLSIHVRLKTRIGEKVETFNIISKIITQRMECEKDASGMAQSEQGQNKSS